MAFSVADDLVTDLVYILDVIELVPLVFRQPAPEFVELRFDLFDVFVLLGGFEIVVFELMQACFQKPQE